MSYSKQTWTDGSTPIDASHMNHIEDGIEAVDQALSGKANSSDLSSVATSGSYNDLTNKPTIPSVPSVVNAHSTSTSDVYSANQTNSEITGHIKTSNTTSGTDTYSCTYINNTINANTPVGVISAYGGSSAPSGYLLCDGSAVSRSTYSDLFSVIGTSYGSGNGSTTFNIPNLKGRIPVGYNSSETEFNSRGKTGGSKYLQEHNHIINMTTYTEPGGLGYGDRMYNNRSNDTIDKTYTPTTANAGTGNAGNLQPYLVVNYIIKATKN